MLQSREDLSPGFIRYWLNGSRIVAANLLLFQSTSSALTSVLRVSSEPSSGMVTSWERKMPGIFPGLYLTRQRQLSIQAL